MIDPLAVQSFRQRVADLKARTAAGTPALVPIAVVGAVNRGKSALINALLGRAVCEVSPLPNTFESAAFDAPEWGIALIDTPGYDGPRPGGDELAMNALEECAVAVFVFMADPPLSPTDIAFLERIRALDILLIPALTKIDQFEQAALDDVLSRSAPIVGSAVLVSAQTGLGIENLRHLIARLGADRAIQKKSAAIRRQSVLNLGQRLLEEVDRQAAQYGALVARTEQAQYALEALANSAVHELHAFQDALPGRVVQAVAERLTRFGVAERDSVYRSKDGTALILGALASCTSDPAGVVSLANAWNGRLRAVLDEAGLDQGKDAPLMSVAYPDPARTVIPVRMRGGDINRASFLAQAERLATEYAAKVTPAQVARVQHWIDSASGRVGAPGEAQAELQLLQAARVHIQQALDSLLDDAHQSSDQP